MESLKDIVSDIRVFLYGGILTLPLTIAGTLSILGLFTANYAILFFLVGFLILTPLAASILNFVGGALAPGGLFKAKTGDVCRLVIPYSTMSSPSGVEEGNVVSSSYVSMIAFFIGYIFTNALQLYQRQAEETTITVQTSSASDVNTKVANRKAQAMVAMISILVFAVIVLGFRFYTGCESTTGLIVSSFIFVFMGHGWYQALSKIGQDRLSDLFGIANRLLPPSAINNAPIACIPIQA
jgi:hypothetical protein